MRKLYRRPQNRVRIVEPFFLDPHSPVQNFGNTHSDFCCGPCPCTAMSFASKPNTFEQQQEACGLILHSIRFAVQVENSAHKPSHAHGISMHTSKQNPWVKLISSWYPCVPSATSKDCLAVYTCMSIVASDSCCTYALGRTHLCMIHTTEQRSIMQTTCQIINKTQHHGDCQFYHSNG